MTEHISPTPPPHESVPQPEPVVKEIHHHHYHGRGFSVWRMFLGLLIIFIGASWLANAAGWSWNIPADVWRFWPVLIIIAGVSLLVRNSLVGSIIGVVAVVAVVVGLMSWTGGWRSETPTATTSDIKVAKESAATEANLRFHVGATTVRLTGGATDLVNGTFRSNMTTLKTESSVSGTTQRATLEYEANPRWVFGRWDNTLTAALTDALPLDLTIDAGATKTTADLTSVQVRTLTVSAGASTLDLTLGDRLASSAVNLSAGASTIDLTLPRTLGVRLVFQGGLATKTLPDLNETAKNTYETAAYATAEKKTVVTVNAGASTFRLHWN